MTQQDPTEAEMRALCKKAGVLETEMMDDLEHGLLISPAGVQKLKLLSPDRYAATVLGQLATDVARSSLRLVSTETDA